MSSKKRIGPKSFISLHTPFHQELFIPENYITNSQTDVAIIRSHSQPSVNSSNHKSKREGSNESHKSARSTQPLRLERRSCPSIRWLQELEDVLNHHDIVEQRRRALLHKHWTERVWLPLQKQLNQRVSSCGATEIKRRQGLYSQYLQHCNSKGYVFLDTYNPKEYDPFSRHSKKSSYVKLAEIKNTPKEAWMSNYLETECKNCSSQEKLPHNFQSSLVSSSFVTPGTRHGTPSSYSASTFTKTPTENKVVSRALSRYSVYRFTDSVKDSSRGQDKLITMSPSGLIRSRATLTQSTDSHQSV